jgi:hypothetical protein
MDEQPGWVDELGRQIRHRLDPWVVLEGKLTVEAAVEGWWDVSGVIVEDGCGWKRRR